MTRPKLRLSAEGPTQNAGGRFGPARANLDQARTMCPPSTSIIAPVNLASNMALRSVVGNSAKPDARRSTLN